ncbi:hypothetical protein Tcan_03386 [Toxocara canis]|uniref:PH domain-containing protein n=1 Tax=Toxocara canis TaxID=6265 RepID=A0A0B2VY51_TOXCA|nr:hypothetical protein Tcan_03386 [Toxocara canis]
MVSGLAERGMKMLMNVAGGNGISSTRCFTRPEGMSSNSRGGSISSTCGGDSPFMGAEEKSGWLQKWTNYLKGYRQRWFVLDSHANLSYYSPLNRVSKNWLSISDKEARGDFGL